MVLYLSTLESPSHKGLMCQVWLSGSRRKFFEFLQYIFAIYLSYPLGKGCTLHLNKISSLHQRMLWARFVWNWPSCSGEDENVKRSDVQRTKGDQKSSRTFSSGALKLIVYHYPSARKQQLTCTRHCCNSMQWWWQINCMSIFMVLTYTPFHVLA